jgi:hypothetical protein
MTATARQPDSQNVIPSRVIRIMFDVAPDGDGSRLALAGRPGRWGWDTDSWTPPPGDPLDGLAIRAWWTPRGGWRDVAIGYDCPGQVGLARARQMTAVLDPVTGYLLRRAAAQRDAPLHTWCSWVAEAITVRGRAAAAAAPFGVAAADCTGLLHEGYTDAGGLGRWLERMTDRFRTDRFRETSWPAAAPPEGAA